MCRALEPKISGQIMELHHSKHHATYVAGMNAAGKELEQVTKKMALILINPQAPFFLLSERP